MPCCSGSCWARSRASKEMRGHLVWYIKGMPGASEAERSADDYQID